MGDVNHNPGCECLSCHVVRGRMLREIDPIPPSGDIGRQLAEVTRRANEVWAVHKSGPRREMYIFDIDPALGQDETAVQGFVTIERYEEVIAAKDARIAELKSELARRPAAFVDPDGKPEHNPFREFTKDRRMMGP